MPGRSLPSPWEKGMASGMHAVQGTIPVEWNKLANPLVALYLNDNFLTGTPHQSAAHVWSVHCVSHCSRLQCLSRKFPGPQA